jgi:hypothetical protein
MLPLARGLKPVHCRFYVTGVRFFIENLNTTLASVSYLILVNYWQ